MQYPWVMKYPERVGRQGWGYQQSRALFKRSTRSESKVEGQLVGRPPAGGESSGRLHGGALAHRAGLTHRGVATSDSAEERGLGSGSRSPRCGTTAEVALSSEPLSACVGQTSEVALLGPRNGLRSATLAAGSRESAKRLGMSATSAVQLRPLLPLFAALTAGHG
jgi:hypothetical protein